MNQRVCLLLALLFTTGGWTASATSRVDTMKIARRTIKSALEVYRVEFNAYPTVEQGLKSLIQNPGVDGWNGPYLPRLPTDRWGHDFRYRLVDGAPRLDSPGADGKFGTKDDELDPDPEKPSSPDSTPTDTVFRQLALPERGQYEGIKPAVLLSEDDLHGFDLREIEGVIRHARPDFEKEAVVVLPHTEPSGSNHVKFTTPRVEGKRLVCRIERTVPAIGTADMAYYCFVLAVTKGAIQGVELSIEGREAGIVLTIPDKTPSHARKTASRPVWAEEGHRAKVFALAISSDGRFGLSGDEKCTTHLWDLRSGKVERTFSNAPLGTDHQGGFLSRWETVLYRER